MKRTIVLASLYLLATAPLGALAADPAQPAPGGAAAAKSPAAPAAPAAPMAKEEPAPLFKQLDANRDGYVTKDEAKRSADIAARFQDLDADRDGKINTVEFKKTMQPKL